MYMRMHRKPLLIAVLWILLVSQESNAYMIGMFRKLAERENSDEKTIHIAPSPSPVPSVSISSGGVGVDNFGQGSSVDRQAPATLPKEEPIDRITDKRCDISSYRCQDNNNMIACLSQGASGSQGSFLLVQNDGEISLKVNFTDIACKHYFQGERTIETPSQGDQYISKPPEEKIYTQFPSYDKQFYSYATFVTPTNGAYLLFLTALIIGGTWACCKLGKRGRHLEGVPYEELEMGRSESLSAMNVETEGWDQYWDDDWDEEKEVKSPAGNHIGNGQANGFTSKSSKIDGWGNDWDD
ncbi:hypothetical protein F0562_031488 [Nyssa sinensis]|uniref:DUF7356 domain-containing protein n=1 Tax=Nyssa sinensis TaxID=561372 RepID=A0A5J5AYC2_9ASTE|nr:hypothetical protein F0562_031488 [Nyssa sinensis]